MYDTKIPDSQTLLRYRELAFQLAIETYFKSNEKIEHSIKSMKDINELARFYFREFNRLKSSQLIE